MDGEHPVCAEAGHSTACPLRRFRKHQLIGGIPVDWFVRLAKVAGASNPLTAWLVQLEDELAAAELERRVQALEDPLSDLHPDMREVASLIWEQVRESDSRVVELDPGAYKTFARCLAELESLGLIAGRHALGGRFVAGLRVRDPTFTVYMARLFGSGQGVDRVVQAVDSCSEGTWLDGRKLASDCDVPVQLVDAIFRLYEQRGYGIVSKTLGEVAYCGTV